MVVPAGTYFCTPIELLSNVNLHLEHGATLLFSPSMSDYPLAHVDDGSGDQAGCLSPLYANKQHNISITGDGIIDGQGTGWRQLKKSKVSEETWNSLIRTGGVLNKSGDGWYPDAVSLAGPVPLNHLQAAIATTPLEAYAKYRSLMRPNLIRLSECTGVTLTGNTYRQSASWNIHLSLCDDVQVNHITIYNPGYAQNGDGIDLDSCRNVTLSDSSINAGDDGICIKSGMNKAGRLRGRPTENVTITRCTVGTGHGGVVIGSEMSGGVRNIHVSDCVFKGTENGLRFKSVRGRGGVVENVDVKNIQMSEIHDTAILFDLYYMTKGSSKDTPAAVDEGTPTFRNFTITNVTCKSAGRALQLRGLPEMPLQNISLQHVDVTAKEAGLIRDVKGLTLRDVHVHASGDAAVPVEKAVDLIKTDCTGIE